LVHGILGFDKLPVPIATIDYFRGVPAILRKEGNTIPKDLPHLNLAGPVEERANDLKNYLNSNAEVAGRRVHLIAHSMGGLDSRYMISLLDMKDRIITLTTIGTPHKGTPVADVGIEKLQPAIDLLLKLRIDIRGFFNLTTDWCAQFANATPDNPNVRYFSVAGNYAPGFLDLLHLPYDIIVDAGNGPNDGLVPVESAKHGTFLGTWNGDHFRLINWATNILTPPGELSEESILQNYVGLVGTLVSMGY
jgi:triacylglycerol lipase